MTVQPRSSTAKKPKENDGSAKKPAPRTAASPESEDEKKARKNAYVREWRKAHKEHYAAYMKEWRAKRDAKAGKTSPKKKTSSKTGSSRSPESQTATPEAIASTATEVPAP